MGLFNGLKKEKLIDAEAVKHRDNALLEIVRIVSFNDADTLKYAQDCIDHTIEYYEKHTVGFEERGISGEEEISFLQWIGCIDLLINNGYVCESDWKEEKDVFIGQISALRGMDLLSLKIDGEWLDGEQSVPEWCEKLDDKWKKSDAAIAAFDIDSDSYLMFLCKEADMEMLMALAEDFGYRIDHAKNM